MSKHLTRGLASSRGGSCIRIIGSACTAALVLGLAVTGEMPMASARTQLQVSIWPDGAAPRTVAPGHHRPITLGTEFKSSQTGWVTGMRFYRIKATTGKRYGALWTASGRRLSSVVFPARRRSGWQTASLSRPVSVSAGVHYVASYVAPTGRHAVAPGALSPDHPVRRGSLTALRGVYTYGAGVPRHSSRSHYFVDVLLRVPGTNTSIPVTSAKPPVTTDPQPPLSTGFPDASNTGVPTGTTLGAYSGPMTITSPTTINAKRVSGTLVVKAPLTITNSIVNGNIDVDYGKTLTITDSEVDGGTSQAPAIGYGEITMSRVEVRGSRVSVLCGSNCDIQNSWLHAQYLKPGSDWHVNGYVSNGGSNVLVRHNTIACDPRDNSNGGGCTGPGASFGDFAPLKNITYDHNLFKASPGGYCLAAGYNPSKPYGSNPTGIAITNNVFERGPDGKCGVWGAVTSFLDANGNTMTGNTWDDGTAVKP